MLVSLQESRSKNRKGEKVKVHCNDKGSFIGKTLFRGMMPGIRSGTLSKTGKDRKPVKWCVIRLATTMEN